MTCGKGNKAPSEIESEMRVFKNSRWARRESAVEVQLIHRFVRDINVM